MKIWLSKNSEIPVREQLITQITLGIASGDLPVGDKLPSTRELARRFKIHSNTISAAYRKLGEKDLIEFKKGSGFYVSQTSRHNFENDGGLDALIDNFLKTANFYGYSSNEIQFRLQAHFSLQTPELIIVVESDEQLRKILIKEIKESIGLKVEGLSFENLRPEDRNESAVYVALSDDKTEIEMMLPVFKNCLFLKPRSVSDSLQGETRPRPDELIAVVSGWDKFLLWAKTILIAAEVEKDSIILLSPTDPKLNKCLKNTAMVICDSLTADSFGSDPKIRVFNIIADESLSELEAFFTSNNESL